MKAATYMWMSSCQRNELPNSADHGCTSTATPFSIRKPPGLFIQAFTAITNVDPATPAIAMGMPLRKCARGDSRSQP